MNAEHDITFHSMGSDIRLLIGPPLKQVLEVEQPARVGARRSVVARVDIPKGTGLSHHLLDVKRPGGGVPPATSATSTAAGKADGCTHVISASRT